jgi:hypothetical protein
MTNIELRDYFAAKAMQANIIARQECFQSCREWKDKMQEIAGDAYAMAQAMIDASKLPAE